MQFTPLTIDDRRKWAELLAVAFDRTPETMEALLDWLHMGWPVIAWGAWDGDKLAAQYSCRLVDLRLPGGEVITAGMSINMAVHPDYRGQGLIKQVSRPVYEQVAELGGVAGVGFSNAEGVQVDLRSKSYGYQLVGEMVSTALWLNRRHTDSLTLTDEWPEDAPFAPFWHDPARIGFAVDPHLVQHRFARHPFRRYRFGVWQEGECVRGIVVYRPTRIGPLQGASLLAMYGDDPEGLMARWMSALCDSGLRLAHVLTAPRASLRGYLKTLGVSVDIPYTRTPYYLTAKSLCNTTPATLFNMRLWDCMGGDVL